MKKNITIRLDNDVINILDVLASKTSSTKTEIIEKALYAYALNNKKDKSNLLKFAGNWKEEEANRMLNDIYSSRISKE
ncbi:hypothetical protein NF27_GT00020 [Candidatus Jidaibacter acanthamoeba]|uniref:Ribbon-helix-helix protein CopG domain-containing protein n=1 Tax=Candidatus Jidaibacter acanthamoebae TaxID=86105 RepID=A0A0C1MXN1_9RICK|nr:ribbon-helix-helix protein, CopG family [Candidatus Jidaibacter acanthamoeba]KIE04666.1 hypothetical protein NF27_GT00020 [Candidatus Jidaibacter acanthamoeba]